MCYRRGFLTPFDASEYAYYLGRVISANSPQSPLYVTLRTRRRCELKHDGERLAMHNVLNEVRLPENTGNAQCAG